MTPWEKAKRKRLVTARAGPGQRVPPHRRASGPASLGTRRAARAQARRPGPEPPVLSPERRLGRSPGQSGTPGAVPTAGFRSPLNVHGSPRAGTVRTSHRRASAPRPAPRTLPRWPPPPSRRSRWGRPGPRNRLRAHRCCLSISEQMMHVGL